MNERDLQVLEQYPFQVNASRRTRGAFLLDTDKGRLLIREFSGSEQKLGIEQTLLARLKEKGHLVDEVVADREGRLVTIRREYERFFVKTAVDGRECDTRSESEILKAVRELAELHLAMRGIVELSGKDRERLAAPDLKDELQRHNREMKKIYTFIRQKSRKNSFETAYLHCFPSVYDEARKVAEAMAKPAYAGLKAEALENGYFCHGEYSYHNILVNGGRMAAINFERLCLDIQVNDLYLFLRKVLEKQDYDLPLGLRMLEAYESVRPLGQAEREILALRVRYPEKFWKLANYYYNTNKVWIPGKHMEKLEKFLSQQGKRLIFSEKIAENMG